jgi:hypothetical protein
MASSKSPVAAFLYAHVSRVSHVVATTIAVFLICLPLFSQTNQGRILGDVLDQSGGAIVGATVTVTDVARGVSRALITDSAGEYSAPSLLPGTYTVRVEAKGFRAVEHTGVLVQVGEDIRVDLTVQPGEQTQTVTVTAEIPQVETTSATLGGALGNTTISELPMNGRDFTTLLSLRPGVTTYVGGGNFNLSVSGLHADHNMQLVDNIVDFGPGGPSGGGLGLINFENIAGGPSNLLPIDSIQEFNEELNPKAEYGWAPGANVNIGLKSGTNSVHGNAYAYGRDDALDARNLFNTPPAPKTPVSLEQFGGTAGGRILKDKLFWFVGYDGQRYTVGNEYVGSAPVTGSIGKPQLSLVDACNQLNPTHLPIGAPGNPINALSAQLAGLTSTAAGMSCQVSPASSTVENIFPVNDGTNPAGPQFISPNLPSTNPEDNGVLKLDYHINDHHALSASWFIGNRSSNWVASPDQLETRFQNFINNRMNAYAINWAWTPNSSWVNEARAGLHQLRSSNFGDDYTVNPASPWPTGYGINTGVTNPSFFGFPYLQISNLSNFALGHGRQAGSGTSGEYDFGDNVSHLRGKHALKFGGEYIRQFTDSTNLPGTNIRPGAGQGNIKFSSLQNYLQGVPLSGSVLVGNTAVEGRIQNFAGFFQDDWRILKKLTLNLGLRYEYTTPPSELHNLYGGFYPGLGLVQAGVQVPSLFNPDYKELSPRIGLAWDVNGNGRTVVRAGFSIMYDTVLYAGQIATPQSPTGADIVVNHVTTPGSQLGSFSVSYNNAQLQPGWQNNGPNNPLFPISTNNREACGDGLAGDPGPCVTSGVIPTIRVPHFNAWNLDIQRALTNSLTLEVAYVGNHVADLNGVEDINQPALGAGWFGPHNAAGACLASKPLYNTCKASTADEIAAEPYHQQFPYLSFINMQMNLYESNYNGMQVTLTERNYHGLYLLGAYTYAHALDDMSGQASNLWRPQDNQFPLLGYGNSDYDIRHQFNLTATYTLPGKKTPGQALEGWQISSVVTIRTGTPWPIQDRSNDFVGTGEFKNSSFSTWDFTGNPKDFTSGNFNIPCYGPAPNCTLFPRDANGVPQPPAACMNAAQANGPLAVASLINFGCYVEGSGVLTPPAYGSIGTTGRNIFSDQGFRNWDFSVIKKWKFTERYSAEFRADFFNVLNHPNVSNPYGAHSNYDNNDPNTGLGMGCGCITPDAAAGNFVLGSGSARDIQLGLRLFF